jgi:hypothetical protein
LAATSAVWLCYLVARELGLSAGLAAAGAIILGVFPVFLFTSVQTLSDTPATAWSLATLFAALRSRGHRAWAVAAGASLAMAVLVRPTNLLLGPALLVLLGLDWRRLALFVLGGLPGAAWLAFYNHALYGHPLRSGYGGDIFAAFALSHGAPTALHFAKWLALLLPAVVLILPFAALTRGGTRRREWLALTLAFAAITGCYAFYEVSHEVWWCLRFILPRCARLDSRCAARGGGARPRSREALAAGISGCRRARPRALGARSLVVLVPATGRFHDETLRAGLCRRFARSARPSAQKGPRRLLRLQRFALLLHGFRRAPQRSA